MFACGCLKCPHYRLIGKDDSKPVDMWNKFLKNVLAISGLYTSLIYLLIYQISDLIKIQG